MPEIQKLFMEVTCDEPISRIRKFRICDENNPHGNETIVLEEKVLKSDDESVIWNERTIRDETKESKIVFVNPEETNG